MANNRELSQFANVVGYNGGNIGIGTDNPGNVLHLQKNGGDAILELQNSGNGNHSGIFFVRESSGGVNKGAANIHVESNTSGSGSALVFGCGNNISPTGSERLRITSGGNLGINRTDPNQRLNVSGNIEVNAYDNTGGGGGYNTSSGLIIGNLYDAGKSYTGSDDRTACIWQERGLDLDFATNNTLRMKITYDGNVGINTTSNNDGAHFQHYQSEVRHQSFQSNNGDLAIVTDNNSNPAVYVKGTGTADLVNIFANTTEVFTITSAGLMGLGASSPGSYIGGGENLVIAGSGDAGMTIATGTSNTGSINFADGTSGDARYRGRFEYSHSSDALDIITGATTRMRIASNGEQQHFGTLATNINIANTASAGNQYEFLYCQHSSTGLANGTNSFRVATDGDVFNTNNSYGSLSDQRLKENIVDATSQWDDIKGLQIRKYNFRENTGHETHTQLGLIAQEVESVSPGLVETSAVREGETVLDADGNQLESIKSINYSVLYMKAVKALQEAQTRIETLETQHTDLLARVTTLEGS